MTDNKYLLEIGVEELPARFIDDALEQLRNNTEKTLEEKRIIFENIETYATPRRLVLVIKGLAEKQKTIYQKVKGPAKRIAYDNEGNPTKALKGFMRGQGVDIDQITLQEYKGEIYVYANVKKEGKVTEDVLSENMPNIIRSIVFPKSMKWGGKNIRFARPIRWIVSIYNNKVVPFDLEGIKVGNVTRGHRFLGSSYIELNSVDEYFDVLEKNYVIVDQNKRRDIIKYGSKRLAKEKGGNLLLDPELLEEVTYLVEYPTPLIGRIAEEYLELPVDVIITPMKEHLRYFPVVDDSGRLLPYFITVRNGNEEYLDIVRKGNEKVLEARLEDAKFFYYEDIKNPLENYVDELKNIIFQEKLGTLYDKTIRVQKLADKIGDYLEVGQETKNNINRAAYLSKADLVTKMVDEFTELQGRIGMEYAKQSGENEIVSLAIYEQYLPRFSGDQLPTTTAGAILSIADKLDTIAGCFAIEIQPTGSQDPYGLRRQALGIINIILDRKLDLNLDDIIDFALYIYVEENGLVFDYKTVKQEILEFFNGRIKNMFNDMGIRYDIIDGVIATGINNIYDLKLRADKLNTYIESEGLEDVLTTFNRVANLAKNASSTEVKRDLLVKEEEIELYEAFNNIEDKVINWLNKKEYDKALEQFILLKEPVDNFFDNVMVMVDDEKVRENRLNLLAKISETMLMICDLSKIVK
ncbi:glycyl-tRNA synthetase beta chain [Keratinibaculum paraultunense]|uniref:Glycine--tRNA ligase beta subunit n=1 Tax=Keratinibaculum paraultunense TaxID=1278232 RepID=A0A4R3KZU4_9FIRM|nr:glycine--tRNA ligase subunit beta [Keratinibaculum paraultunense]QQY80483.1 glycine--tRNA ligase subunit beta [Keratinibaculum paraultunense]TCS91202.1 glycyl-tRNA synthetase beta chain [Keratinibaculum paraultunense]